MPHRADISSILALGAGSTLLSACVMQPRIYSASELARVADKCEIAESEVAQGSSQELLFLLTPAPSDDQLDCVTRWAKRRQLHLVYIESIEREPTGSTQPH